MLNTDGGTLYIGVSNTGSHVGLHPDFVYLSKGRDDYDLADVKDKFELLFYNDMRFNIGLLCGGRLLREFIDFRWEERDRRTYSRDNGHSFPGSSAYVRRTGICASGLIDRTDPCICRHRRLRTTAPVPVLLIRDALLRAL